jgi:exopolysaccharide biosynthesis predicted pyruvyltransferase EpsI
MLNNLQDIKKFIIDINDTIYIDHPFHFNVGDLLIMHGAYEYLKNNNIHVKSFVCTKNISISKLIKQITPSTTIFLHGGGNFGDLYPVHQKLREKIVQNFPNNRIILLPQSAYFESINNLEISKSIFKKHNDLILFTRDTQSFEILSQFSKNTFLMPDMAHFLYNRMPKKHNFTGSTLYFLRKDKENSCQQKNFANSNSIQHIDWQDLITKEDYKNQKKLKLKIKLNKLIPFLFNENEIFQEWLRTTDEIIKRVSTYYLNYDHIYTSRLHGHILASLLEIPSTIIDNSYHKNSLYFNTWIKESKMHKLHTNKTT